MSGITLSQAQQQLGLWLEADSMVAKNQSYSHGQRQLTRADAGEISAKIKYWDAKVKDLSGVSSRRRGVSQVTY